MKIKVTTDNWAAEVMLFIPIQTLKMPKVRVSKEKYSTVPKSDTTSIQTRANPAKIAGLARGRPTYNITDFLNTHPGGNKIILDYGGLDITNNYIFSLHSMYAYNMLSKYKIGSIINTII